MVKKLTRHGNSMALVIDKPILELLKITAETPLEIITDGRNLIISPQLISDRKTALDFFLMQIKETYSDLLERLDG